MVQLNELYHIFIPISLLRLWIPLSSFPSNPELQRQLGHNRYQPIWEMLHKLRDVIHIRVYTKIVNWFIRLVKKSSSYSILLE